jgi:hypothetical protein
VFGRPGDGAARSRARPSFVRWIDPSIVSGWKRRGRIRLPPFELPQDRAADVKAETAHWPPQGNDRSRATTCRADSRDRGKPDTAENADDAPEVRPPIFVCQPPWKGTSLQPASDLRTGPVTLHPGPRYKTWARKKGAESTVYTEPTDKNSLTLPCSKDTSRLPQAGRLVGHEEHTERLWPGSTPGPGAGNEVSWTRTSKR